MLTADKPLLYNSINSVESVPAAGLYIISVMTKSATDGETNAAPGVP